MKCTLTKEQGYERFEKLPMEVRRKISDWLGECLKQEEKLVRVNQEESDVGGRPEKWRILGVDTCRWKQFSWRPISYYTTPDLSSYDSPEVLFAGALANLDFTLVPLVVLSNRYEHSSTVVCVEVGIDRGLAKTFIRSQREQTAKQLKEGTLSPGLDELERQVRKAWEDQGLTKEQYRGFSLKLFQIRQEEDPPFIMLYCGGGQRLLVWFRDIHLAQGPFYRGLLGAQVEHISWPNYTHRPEADPPYSRCERPECASTDGLVKDSALLEVFQRHRGPYKRGLVEARKERWRSHYKPLVDAECAELTEARDKNIVLSKYEEQLVREQVVAHHKEFKRCARCKNCKYCSSECQKSDWTRHKPYCYP